MKFSAKLFALTAATLLLSLFLFAAAKSPTPARARAIPPPWAYPVSPPDSPEPHDLGSLRHVPDSTVAFTLAQVSDPFFAPDWHPNEHPPMPWIVARGREPDVYACGYCHRAVGTGGPENANITGLPAAYIRQQLADFKSGARASSAPHRLPVEVKALLAKKVTEAEVATAAAYFSAIPARSLVTVVETDTVPKTFVTGWHLAALAGDEKEPIGQRIIEIPENLEQFKSRDSHARFVAYVPVGSIQKGRGLATTGGKGRTVQCAPCHGAGLRGAGPVPGIAGRSAVYLVRQLYDFQHGTRAGPSSALMSATVQKLTLEDMIALAAYAASLAP